MAALAAALVVYVLYPNSDPASLGGAVCFGLFGIVASMLVYKVPTGASGSISFIAFLAATLVAPSWIAVAVAVVASLVSEIIRKRTPLKLIFNVAQMTLSISCAILAYRWLGGQSLIALKDATVERAALETLIPLAALTLVFFAVNSFAVSGAIASSENRRILHVWRQNTHGTVLYDALSLPVVFLFALTYIKTGPFGVALFSLPLLGLRQLYKANRQLENVNLEFLELMVKAIEARDPYTSGHSRRVAHFSKIIARAIGLSAREIEHIGTAALLHDVGKIHEEFAPILRKPDRLTPEEWAIMQTHPIKSAELVSTVSHMKDLIAPIRHHHENWDGTGYPDGLAQEAIPLASRVILFADTIDAMTTDRPYRAALGEAQVRAELIRCRGTQFDPKICDQLLISPMFGLVFYANKNDGVAENAGVPSPKQQPKLAIR